MVTRAYLIFAAASVFILSVVAIKTNKEINNYQGDVTSEVIGVNTSITTKPTESISPSPSLILSPTKTPTAKSTISSLTILNIDNYVYPESFIKQRTDNLLDLEVGADIKVVTEWYEKRVREDGYKVKSFVKTSTNGAVHNVISAASSENEVNVDIKNQTDLVKILIKFNN